MTKRSSVLAISVSVVGLLDFGLLWSAPSAAGSNAGPEAVSVQITREHTGYTAFQNPLTFPLEQVWTASQGKPLNVPLIAEGKVFEILLDEATQTRNLYAFDLDTGAVVWGPVAVAGSDYTYDNGAIYSVNILGLVQATDAATGSPKWSRQLPYQNYFEGEPNAANGVVYLSGNGYTYALSEADGSQLWSQYVGGDTSSPTLTPTKVIVAYPCSLITVFKRSTGAVKWQDPGECSGAGGSNTAAYSLGRVYVPDAVLRVVNAFNVLDGTVEATYPYDLLPTIAGKTGLFVDGINHTLNAVDLETQATLWTFSAGVNYLSNPIQVNQDVFVADSMGLFSALDAASGAVLWQTNLGAAGGVTGYNAGEGVIAVATETGLIVFR